MAVHYESRRKAGTSGTAKCCAPLARREAVQPRGCLARGLLERSEAAGRLHSKATRGSAPTDRHAGAHVLSSAAPGERGGRRGRWPHRSVGEGGNLHRGRAPRTPRGEGSRARSADAVRVHLRAVPGGAAGRPPGAKGGGWREGVVGTGCGVGMRTPGGGGGCTTRERS